MKRKTLQQHKEATLVFEEGIYEIEAINNMLVSQSNKKISIQKHQKILKKIGKYYTNYHKTNHNVETYRVKRKEDHVHAIFEVTIS